MNEKVTILIPSCGINFEKALKPCIESLVENTNFVSGNTTLLLVMNGMKDTDIFDEFSASINNANIFCQWNDEPLGYVGAINAGLEQIKSGEKQDYVLFLNDDVLIHDSSWLRALMEPFKTDPLMGIVGAKSLPCPITGVDFPLGFCELVKMELIEKLGGLDPIFGIGYGDDIDIAIRAMKAGYHTYSYVNGWDRKLHKSVGQFPISHIGEGTMHSQVLFSLDDWNAQTAKNRGLLAERYWETVHVVVPVYQRYTKLDKALESLHAQLYWKIKVHVVSDGNDPKIKEIVEKKKAEWAGLHTPEIEYTFVEHEGLYGSRPRISVLDSLKSNDKEWVCFCDSDNFANPDWILRLWQETFLKDVGGAWCKIYHIEENKELPLGENQKQPTWWHIDSLNFMVRVDIAKKHAQKWQHDPNLKMEKEGLVQEKSGPVQAGVVMHDFLFADTCFKEKPWAFVDEVLGTHGQSMSILVQAVCWNEEKMIPFFLRHYLTIADKIIVYDGGSTDKSLELLRACDKVEIVSVPNEKMKNIELMNIRNEAWKSYAQDFDWIIVCDMDEFLWHRDLKNKLEEFRRVKVTLPTVVGYQMIADTFPNNQIQQIYDYVRQGFPDPDHLNKSMIFNPKCIDIRYDMGCHHANPAGWIKKSTEALYLLHYKYAGYTEFIERNKRAAERVSEEDRKNNWAFHYARDAQMSIEEFQALKKKAAYVIDDSPTINPLAARQDLRAQNGSVFREIIDLNQYRVVKDDFMGRNIIDVGANIGVFSLLANEYGADRIVAVEPQPATLEILKRNTEGRGILVLENAVGLRDGEYVQVVQQKDFCETDGRLYTKPAASGIKTVSLDHLVTFIDDGKPILLKVDCEGAEYDLLYGASFKTLNKIQTICIEMHEDIYRTEGQKGLINKLRNYLTSVGFKEEFAEEYVKDKVKLFRYERTQGVDDGVTAVISIFNRPELLRDQVEAIRNQTLQPKEIIVWWTKSKHWEKWNEEGTAGQWVETEFDIPEGVTLVKTDNDLMLPARFAAALFAKTPYVWLLDDDVFPASGYLEETIKVSKRENAVMSAYGMLYDGRLLSDMVAQRYGDHGDKNEEPMEVDTGGHSWFGKKEWFSTFFREEPLSPTEGDDLHFAYTLRKYTDVKMFVSAVPKDNPSIWANTNVDAGLGLRALHARRWEDPKIWTNPEAHSWTTDDQKYLKENFNKFIERRCQILDRYRIEKGWTILRKQPQKTNDKKIEVTVDICTKNRYHSTLPLTLLSVLMQTYPVSRIIIVDDSEPQADGKIYDLREDPMYQYIFSIILKRGIAWEVIYGHRQGQHKSHQIVWDKTQSGFIWRLDDDEYAEPNVLEELVKQMKDGVGCVAGLVLDPKNFQKAPEGYFNNNRLADINTRENTQWMDQPKGKLIECEHLYSSFLYRKVEDIKYCLELSPAAHREETLFSYEYVRKGWKDLVTTNVITWHFRNPQGGIRSFNNPEFWAGDDKIFQRKLASWNINTEGKKLIVLDSGIGDAIVFMEILPEVLKKYPKLIIGTYYFTLFKNFAVELIHPWQAKDIIGDQMAEVQNVYRYLWKESDAGRKLNLLQAYREIFIEDKT